MIGQATLKCILTLAVVLTTVAQTEAQERSEEYRAGYRAGACEVFEAISPVLEALMIATPPDSPELPWATLSAAADQCDIDSPSFDSVQKPPEEQLPAESERRIGEASCAELERRYTQLESKDRSEKSTRDRLYESNVMYELQVRCW